ncbi:MAG: hypothetical protein GF355_11090 [Candidatus Eisenbacteria bacterium]|nr:hypothetical protein [Candidatus Eisenbacteria bacterium]
MRPRMSSAAGWFAALAVLLAATSARSQEGEPYIVGPEDVLTVSVWEHPELSTTTTVAQGGMISFPPIGDVQAAGKSPRELARHLEEVLQTFLRQRVQVTVSVTEYRSRRVHVTGDVSAPGRYSFAEIPHLLEVLGAAGGPTPSADLTRVRILRPAAEDTTVITVNLDQALQSGNLEGVPQLHPGDLIYVGSRMEEGQTVVPGEEGIAYVLGAVARPGPVRVGDGLALTRLLAMAGGMQPNARADRTRLLALGVRGGSNWVLETDVKEMLETGDPGPTVRQGEMVYVPPAEPGLAGTARTVLVELSRFSRDLVNLLIIGDYLQED